MAFRKTDSNAGKRAASLFKKVNPDDNGKSDFYLARFLRGELSLTITFWTFFITVPLLGWMIFSQLIFPSLDPSGKFSGLFMTLWILLAPAYMTLASIALWRAAKKPQVKPSLSQMACIAAVLGLIGAIAYAVLMCGAWMMLNA